jgi:hypothetical protein
LVSPLEDIITQETKEDEPEQATFEFPMGVVNIQFCRRRSIIYIFAYLLLYISDLHRNQTAITYP